MAIIGNEFISFNAASLIYEGAQVCLKGNALPLVPGLTLSGVNPTYTGDINLQGWPTIIRTNVESVVHGNVLTVYGEGINQILFGWDETATSSATGMHSSLYIRNKNPTTTAGWSSWYEVLDSDNFTKYIATKTGEGASGTWNINISGIANTTNYLIPITANGTYQRATYNILPGSNNVVIWSEAFGDSSLRYTTNGNQHEYTHTGDIVFYLSPNDTADELLLNMYINGIYEGNFKGNLNGIADKALNANLTTITDTLTYFDNATGHFNYTNYIKYLNHLSVATESGITNAKGYSDGIIISSDATYYSLADVITQQNGILKYGDAGPQIRFTVADGYQGVLLFNSHPETAGSWPSFHFLGRTVSNASPSVITPINITIKSAGIVASQKLTVGAEILNNTYSLSITGESEFNSNIHMNNALIHFQLEQQYIEWYNTASQRIINDDVTIGTGLKWNGIGTYYHIVDNNQLLYLNISHYNGINITTQSNVTLFHNNNIIPAANTANVGSSINPIYIQNGILLSTTYSLSASIAEGVANRIAFYDTNTSITNTGHYISINKIAVNSQSEPTDVFYVEGTSRFSSDITLGTSSGGNKTISYNGTHTTSTVITFMDNSTNSNGNGVLIGSNGLTALGAGLCLTTSNLLSISGVSVPTKALYLLSDTNINIEGNALTFSNRIGIQITTSGHVLPVKAEANNSGQQNLGSSNSRWAALYVGIADTYGGPRQPIYWNSGVPTVIDYTIGANLSSGTINTLVYYSGTTTLSETTLTSNGSYLADISYLSINHTTQSNYRLYVEGTSYFGGDITFAPQDNLAAASKIMWSGSEDNASIYYKVAAQNTGRLVLNTGTDDNCLLTLAHNDSETMCFNNSIPNFYPITTNTGTLGIAANGREEDARRWSKLYLGTADSYGSYGKAIYWNAGVPAETYPIQYTTWSIANGSTGTTITKTGKYFGDTYVIALVVTSGETYLTGVLSWSSTANSITISSSTAITGGTVSGYILTARGEVI